MRLRLVNVTKKFFSLRGTVTALNEINLDIKDKEFFVLLGPSGCGKSTLLNLIAGLEKPTYGEIFFDNRIVVSKKRKIFLTPKERNVAFVFQSYALYPHLNVFENIAFPLRIIGLKGNAVKTAVEKAASTLEITNLLLAKPAELSGGQRQRVAIARAIVRQPNVFLLDEPLSNLDAQLRVSMRAELKNLQRRLGITTVYVTHDQTEAMSLGDRIAVLRAGKIEQIDTSQRLYDNPVNAFVARFIGYPPMNLLETSFVEEDGMYFVFIGDKKLKLPEDKIETLKGLRTNSFLLGIRPEHIYINPSETYQLLPAEVVSIEPLGRDMLVYVNVGGLRMAVLTSDKKIKETDTVNIGFDLKKSYIFELF